MEMEILGMAPGTWGEWAAAFATVGAVVAAFVVPIVMHNRRKPKIYLRHRAVPGENLMSPGGITQERQHWIQLEVVAEKGRNTAKGVQLELIKIEPVEGTVEIPHDIAIFDWTLQPGNPQVKDVAPGAARKIDAAYIRANDSDLGRHQGWYLPVKQGESSPAWRFDPGRYRVRAILTAADTDAVMYEWIIRYEGVWFDGDSVWDHFGLEELREISPP